MEVGRPNDQISLLFFHLSQDTKTMAPGKKWHESFWCSR